MAELRWVLLGLGMLVVVGVYLWGRGIFRRNRLRRFNERRRAEPHISGDLRFDQVERADAGHQDPSDEEADAADDAGRAAADGDAEGGVAAEPQRSQQAPERIITIRFIPKAAELSGDETVTALRQAGLEHGRFDIFHLHADTPARDTLFSVASLTEPGSFDLTKLASSPVAGLSFFMVLPGPGDPVARFDAMVETARTLALELEAELFDDRGSSWSIQRERYVREEIIRYRHQLMQTEVVGNARK